MSEVTALLFGGVVVGALFDAYAYYKYKYAERALDLAENKRGAGGGAGSGAGSGADGDEGQKTLAEEFNDSVESEGAGESGGRKTLAQRLKEVENERAERAARGGRASKNEGVLASVDGAVVFEPSNLSESGEAFEGEAGVERCVYNSRYAEEEKDGDSAVVSGENGFRDSISALRESISDLNGVLRKKSRRGTRGRSGGSASELGDASDGASFSGIGSSGGGYGSGNYDSGDYGVVSS